MKWEPGAAVLLWLKGVSETHADTDGWSNDRRTETEERAGIGVTRKFGSVGPVQPNLWNDLNPATDLKPDIRTNR